MKAKNIKIIYTPAGWYALWDSALGPQKEYVAEATRPQFDCMLQLNAYRTITGHGFDPGDEKYKVVREIR